VTGSAGDNPAGPAIIAVREQSKRGQSAACESGSLIAIVSDLQRVGSFGSKTLHCVPFMIDSET
jgi:hypothetical protein